MDTAFGRTSTYCKIFVRAVFASIRRRAALSASNRRARCGAVTFIQRFSDALNFDPHLHSLALDGIYVEDGSGEPVFRRVPPPSDAEVARVADRVHRRFVRLLQRRGLGPQVDPAEADTLWHDAPLLAELHSASVSGRIAAGPRADRGIVRVGDGEDMGDATLPAGKCCAAVAGFSVHVGVCVPARDRMRRERLAFMRAGLGWLQSGCRFWATAGCSTGSREGGGTERRT